MWCWQTAGQRGPRGGGHHPVQAALGAQAARAGPPGQVPGTGRARQHGTAPATCRLTSSTLTLLTCSVYPISYFILVVSNSDYFMFLSYYYVTIVLLYNLMVIF